MARKTKTISMEVTGVPVYQCSRCGTEALAYLLAARQDDADPGPPQDAPLRANAWRPPSGWQAVQFSGVHQYMGDLDICATCAPASVSTIREALSQHLQWPHGGMPELAEE